MFFFTLMCHLIDEDFDSFKGVTFLITYNL